MVERVGSDVGCGMGCVIYRIGYRMCMYGTCQVSNSGLSIGVFQLPTSHSCDCIGFVTRFNLAMEGWS